ncbi:MAG: ATP-dependent DNA helicase [Patescibacteria group bacterium]
MTSDVFNEKYKELNARQREAVEAIDGPVMVVAGPGTGKTQVLACRIANILVKTDTKADSILCLTFTNSAVKEMRSRLRKYIGAEAGKVAVSTFHSFGMSVVEKYFSVLDMDIMPRIMDDSDAIALCDEILHAHDWEHLRPRSDTSRYFKDLKDLISLLKRERVAPDDFEYQIKQEIKSIESDPENISSRGKTKGELKKDAQSKIERLAHTAEAVKFYEIYEKVKKERGLFDYDDVLEALVRIVEASDDAANFIREQYLYVLIDEHQDSSGVQNRFLESVWGKVEMPNIFVVGDDRQLIYGFGGASLQYFENFKHAFGKAKLINLVDNYRSTQIILDTAHELLASSMSKEKLQSHREGDHPLLLIEASYARDEIIACGMAIKDLIAKNDIALEDAAILVPNNRMARLASAELESMGLAVASSGKKNLFDLGDARALVRVLKIIADPGNSAYIAESLLDPLSEIPPLEAHKFMMGNSMRNFNILEAGSVEEKNINSWLGRIKAWITEAPEKTVYTLLQHIGSELLINTAESHTKLLERIEIVRTLLSHAAAKSENDPHISLADFLEFLARLESYGAYLPISTFGAEKGVRVMTMHSSKGQEFDFVWIAHLDKNSLAGSKHSGFALPSVLEEKVEKKDEEVQKRELYVAITRAKRFCTLSYALRSPSGRDLELANIVANIEGSLEKQSAEETEESILKSNPKLYIGESNPIRADFTLEDLQSAVAKDYEDRKVSVSLLNSFFECPWKWYFGSLLRLPQAQTESLVFGDIVHVSIDKILKLARVPKESEIEEIVIEEVSKSNYGSIEKQKIIERDALDIVKKWVGARLPEISNDRENEKTISVNDDRFPHLQIYGKIDLVETIEKGKVRVTDFKTGNPKKKSDFEKLDSEGRMSDYMRQLAMYSYLIKQSSKNDIDVSESVLEFVQAEASLMFIRMHIEEKHIELLISDIKDYDNLVKSGEWTNRPCNFKSYGKKSAVCEYCALKNRLF